MNPTCLVIGGCRSGKSAHALEMARTEPGRRRLFIATCRPSDAEMQDRVARHRRERSRQWQTLEEPLAIAETLAKESAVQDVIIVDCLTLWISNLLLDHGSESAVRRHIEELAGILPDLSCPVFMVTNEVGTGIVPENDLSRLFRDCVGFANQRVAAAVCKVVWMVAGIPVVIKGDGS
jgi:adenosylcobinamide kinase/adenosylcobinamide-phosphate guanylyltransferase